MKTQGTIDKEVTIQVSVKINLGTALNPIVREVLSSLKDIGEPCIDRVSIEEK